MRMWTCIPSCASPHLHVHPVMCTCILSCACARGRCGACTSGRPAAARCAPSSLRPPRRKWHRSTVPCSHPSIIPYLQVRAEFIAVAKKMADADAHAARTKVTRAEARAGARAEAKAEAKAEAQRLESVRVRQHDRRLIFRGPAYWPEPRTRCSMLPQCACGAQGTAQIAALCVCCRYRRSTVDARRPACVGDVVARSTSAIRAREPGTSKMSKTREGGVAAPGAESEGGSAAAGAADARGLGAVREDEAPGAPLSLQPAPIGGRQCSLCSANV